MSKNPLLKLRDVLNSLPDEAVDEMCDSVSVVFHNSQTHHLGILNTGWSKEQFLEAMRDTAEKRFSLKHEGDFEGSAPIPPQPKEKLQ